jgi:hypothetical protein
MRVRCAAARRQRACDRPVWSRTSAKTTAPMLRCLSTQPQSVTRLPTSPTRSVPQPVSRCGQVMSPAISAGCAGASAVPALAARGADAAAESDSERLAGRARAAAARRALESGCSSPRLRSCCEPLASPGTCAAAAGRPAPAPGTARALVRASAAAHVRRRPAAACMARAAAGALRPRRSIAQPAGAAAARPGAAAGAARGQIK